MSDIHPSDFAIANRDAEITRLRASNAEWEQRYAAISHEYKLCRQLLIERTEEGKRALKPPEQT